jgi:hypothetical protein
MFAPMFAFGDNDRFGKRDAFNGDLIHRTTGKVMNSAPCRQLNRFLGRFSTQESIEEPGGDAIADENRDGEATIISPLLSWMLLFAFFPGKRQRDTEHSHGILI